MRRKRERIEDTGSENRERGGGVALAERTVRDEFVRGVCRSHFDGRPQSPRVTS